MQTPDLQRGDDREADRPAADHQRHLPAADVGLRHGVNADCEWLGQRGVFGSKTVRHLPE